MLLPNRHHPLFSGKWILLPLLLLLTQLLQAQQDDNTTTTEEQDKEERIYFKKRWPEDTTQLYDRSVPADKVQKMKKEDDFWYADKEFTNKEKREEQKEVVDRGEPMTSSTWFQTILWLVIIGSFAGAIMWFLADSQVGIFRKRDKPIAAAEEEELSTEDIFAINYQKEIDKAAQQGNYRLAIRLMFLRLLKNMSERNVIQYKQGRTNLDYLVQLQSTHYYQSFFRITRNYEYAWYGLFDINAEMYEAVKKDFSQFERTLG